MQRAYDQGIIIQTRPGAIPRLKRYLDEQRGRPLTDVWTDIPPVNARAAERLGFQTQKPRALLERILSLSSGEDDVVLDPFCGCGTTIDAALKLGRRWIGIDITELATTIIRTRIQEQYGAVDYVFRGEPSTIDEAEALADLDKHEFQRWACERLGISGEHKKGADRGIDGEIVGVDANGESWRALVSVKGGKPKVEHVRDLVGTITRERAVSGILLTLKSVTGPMKREAADAGFTDDGVPRIQLLTVADVLADKQPILPERSVKARTARRLKVV